jgi:HD-like signal output (HDOD) protein
MLLPEWMRRRPEAAGPTRPVLETLKAHVGSMNKLPTLPASATKAMSVAKDPNSSLTRLSAVIERDPALAAGILKLANSPLYRTQWAVESLHHAVVKLGAREVQNVILAVGMRSLFRTLPRDRRLRYECLWKHSFVTGTVCRNLGRALGMRFEGEEFAGGLSHDIGRVLIALGVPDKFDAADPLDFIEGPDLLVHEQAILGTDHCYFGAWFASVNNLPPAVSSCIQFHHTPELADEHRQLVALVATADHMANYMQRENQVEGYDPLTNSGWEYLLPFVRGGDFNAIAAPVMTQAAKEAAEEIGVAA